MEELVEMSTKELERYQILEAIKNKHITQAKGAVLLRLSTRQVRNLMRQMMLSGPKGLVSKKRGKESNRCYPIQFKQQILHLIQGFLIRNTLQTANYLSLISCRLRSCASCFPFNERTRCARSQAARY